MSNRSIDKHAEETHLRDFRRVILRWVGTLTTAFTIFSTLEGLIDFSHFVRTLTDAWKTIAAAIVNSILRVFSYEVDIPEAVALFAVVSCLGVAASAQLNRTTTWTLPYRVSGWLIASLFGATYFVFVVMQTISSDPRMEDQTILYFLLSLTLSAVFSAPIFYQNRPQHRPFFRRFGYTGFVAALGMIAIYIGIGNIDNTLNIALDYLLFFLLSLVVTFMYYASNAIEITKRSFSIFVVISSLIAINFVSRGLETHGL